MICDLRELQNKTRRGLYIYLKEEGKKGKYFKYQNKVGQIDATIQYEKDRKLGQAKGTYQQYIEAYEKKSLGEKEEKRTRITRQAEQYLAKVRKRGEIETHIQRGVNNVVVKNVHQLTPKGLEAKKMELLGKLVLDQEILRLLVKEENLRKIKHRFEFRITIEDTSGQKVADASKANITPDAVVQEIKLSIRKGETIESMWVKKLRELGYNVNESKRGNVVGNVNIIMVFRRG